MKPWFHLVWFIPLVAFGITRIQPGLNAPTCTDFLANAGVQFEGLKYLSCEPARNAQIPTLRARYEVSGVRAAEVESRLRERYGMSPLKFLCCGWEPENGGTGQWPAKRGYAYIVNMTSEETVFNQRTDWPKIKFFVQVDWLLEEP